MPDVDDGTPRPSRGWRRMRELSQQEAADRQTLQDSLIAELGRKPSTLDTVAVELFAATVARARRLRNVGKSDAEERKTAVQIIRATGLRPDKPVATKVEDFSEEMQRLAMPPGGDDEEAD